VSPPQPQPRYGPHLVLFVVTLATATVSGGLPYAMEWALLHLAPILGRPPQELGLGDVWLAWRAGALPGGPVLEELFLWGGTFSVPFLSILLAHEMGHYVAARIHGAPVSPPWFIPGPPLFPLPGTFGAFIRMRAPIRTRHALLDIGAAGPLAGIAVAIPVLLVGLSLSTVGPIRGPSIYEGNSLLYLLAKWLVHGPLPLGHDVFCHPMAMAGWWGILVTSLNLFPVSQLDGGHVAYALLGPRAVTLGRAVFGGLLGLALGLFLFKGADAEAVLSKGAGAWLVWIAIILVIGIEHPPMGDADEHLGRGRRTVAWLCLAVFALTFTPIPLSEEPPELTGPAPTATEVSVEDEMP